MAFKSEAQFQSHIIKKIKQDLPGALVFKMDPTYIQGTPDLLILFEDRWAALEVKKSQSASHRPNQQYYVELMDGMSFADFIYPENEREVLDELYQAFRVRG